MLIALACYALLLTSMIFDVNLFGIMSSFDSIEFAQQVRFFVRFSPIPIQNFDSGHQDFGLNRQPVGTPPPIIMVGTRT